MTAYGIHRPRQGIRYSASSRSLEMRKGEGVPEKYVGYTKDLP